MSTCPPDDHLTEDEAVADNPTVREDVVRALYRVAHEPVFAPVPPHDHGTDEQADICSICFWTCPKCGADSGGYQTPDGSCSRCRGVANPSYQADPDLLSTDGNDHSAVQE